MPLFCWIDHYDSFSSTFNKILKTICKKKSKDPLIDFFQCQRQRILEKKLDISPVFADYVNKNQLRSITTCNIHVVRSFGRPSNFIEKCQTIEKKNISLRSCLCGIYTNNTIRYAHTSKFHFKQSARVSYKCSFESNQSEDFFIGEGSAFYFVLLL